MQTSFMDELHIPYILAYKPIIFDRILTIKLWGSAYMQDGLYAKIYGTQNAHSTLKRAVKV